MSIRFIHTSDWHAGKAFRSFDGDTAPLLRDARISRISRLGELAEEHGATHVLAAGDIYDIEEPTLRTLHQPVEQMRKFPRIHWHVIPGNHDHHRPNGLWDRLRRKGLPDNIRIHVRAEAALLEDCGCLLLPAPLNRRRSHRDPTAYMDEVDSDAGLIRVGLAHGSVTERFGSSGARASNHIDPQRCDSARLSYLALGDWHGQKKIHDRCWYSGSPEPGGFGEQESGSALLVEIDGPGALPRVDSLPTGLHRWVSEKAALHSRKDIDELAARLRAVPGDQDRTLLQLEVEGVLNLGDIEYFNARIAEVFPSVFRALRIDQKRLFPQADLGDLDRINRVGFVRNAAEALKRKAEDEQDPERDTAAEALKRLYLEYRKVQEEET